MYLLNFCLSELGLKNCLLFLIANLSLADLEAGFFFISLTEGFKIMFLYFSKRLLSSIVFCGKYLEGLGRPAE